MCYSALRIIAKRCWYVQLVSMQQFDAARPLWGLWGRHLGARIAFWRQEKGTTELIRQKDRIHPRREVSRILNQSGTNKRFFVFPANGLPFSVNLTSKWINVNMVINIMFTEYSHNLQVLFFVLQMSWLWLQNYLANNKHIASFYKQIFWEIAKSQTSNALEHVCSDAAEMSDL